MKKSLLLVITLLIAMSVFSCDNEEDEAFVVENIDADRVILATNVDEMIAVSDIIVKVEIISQEEVELVDEHSGLVYFGYSNTEAKIKKVFKGNVNEKNIIITEDGYLNNGIYWTVDNYQRSKIGNEYIFFLKENTDRHEDLNGKYYPVELTLSKYVIPKSNKKAKSVDETSIKELELFNIMTKDDVTEYKEWYKEVIAKLKLND